MSLYNYSRWPSFTKEELVCSYTGLENPNYKEFTKLMDAVQVLREFMGVPFTVTSCYRSPIHPKERIKAKGGMHTIAAIDIQVPIEHYHRLLSMALAMDFTGIGINLKGRESKRFIHLDFRSHGRRVWSY